VKPQLRLGFNGFSRNVYPLTKVHTQSECAVSGVSGPSFLSVSEQWSQYIRKSKNQANKGTLTAPRSHAERGREWS
jgi:hypothetical protein